MLAECPFPICLSYSFLRSLFYIDGAWLALVLALPHAAKHSVLSSKLGAYARSGHLVCTIGAFGCSAVPTPPPSGTMAVCTIIAG